MLAVTSRLDSPVVTTAAHIPRCEECQEFWRPADEERWQAYWIDNGQVRTAFARTPRRLGVPWR
jgi:hypothetical protein